MGIRKKFFTIDGYRTERSVNRRPDLISACEEAGLLYNFNFENRKGVYRDRYNILKRCIYQLRNTRVKGGDLRAIAERAYQSTVDDKDGRALPVSAPDPEIDPCYYLYYLAVGSRGYYFPRQERDKACSQLRYAHNHHVPVEYLIGFISQCGSYVDLRRKLRAGETEPWLAWRRKE